MIDFNQAKKAALAKPNDSSEEHWDEQIIPLCEAINEKPNFYTSSSCAGRLALLKIPMMGKKEDAEWLLTSHEETSVNSVMQALENLPDNQIVFRYEPFILHVGCRTLKDAEKLLNLVRDFGLKRCGMISLGENPTVEITSTANISTLIADKGKVLLPDEYIKTLVEIANTLLTQNWELIFTLTNLIKNKL